MPTIAIVDPKAHSQVLFGGRTIFATATFDISHLDIPGQTKIRILASGPRERMILMSVKPAFNNHINVTMFINTDESLDEVKKRLLGFEPRPVIKDMVIRDDDEIRDMWEATKSKLLPR